jgi:hypothetical protein
MKLFRVNLQGMDYSTTGPVYGVSYVVADNSDEAYRIVKEAVDSWGVGFIHERELKSVELIADTERYPDCKTHLHIRPFEYTDIKK